MLEYALSQNVTPSSNKFRNTCVHWLKLNFPDEREDQCEATAKRECSRIRAYWTKPNVGHSKDKLYKKYKAYMAKEVKMRSEAIMEKTDSTQAEELKKMDGLAPKVLLKPFECEIQYLNRESLCSYPDTTVVSASTNHTICLNRAVLSSVSPFMKTLLQSVDQR